ncbi:MAG: hypothetical protein WCA85_07955 [Paraburkholderia sp.]|uniref:hypothetical protein n=1 Tax=Paraburkholderia sp. TaxID=1926495 RepID=UPI003C366838
MDMPVASGKSASKEAFASPITPDPSTRAQGIRVRMIAVLETGSLAGTPISIVASVSDLVCMVMFYSSEVKSEGGIGCCRGFMRP